MQMTDRIPSRTANIIKDLFKGYVCAVNTKQVMSEWFQIETGMKQGCIFISLAFWNCHRLHREKKNAAQVKQALIGYMGPNYVLIL